MPKFRFTEIAINSTEKKKPVEEDKFTYIGLEHLDSGTLTVSRWGSDIAPIGEKLVMKKGDVLFGKRRAYQKKVGIAPFDGIFSAHGMVLRPREEVITKEYFPLFISSDYFLNEAIRISVGSLSPTVNWKDLKDLEFTIPSIEEQKRITPLIWAAIEAKNAYKEQIRCTDDLVKSQFIEMFGDPILNEKGLKVVTLKDICVGKLAYGSGAAATDYDGTTRYIRITDITDTGELNNDVKSPNTIDEKYLLNDGDILFARSGNTVGKTFRYKAEHGRGIYAGFLIRLIPDTTKVLPDYVFGFTKSAFYEDFVKKTQRAVGQPNINAQEYGDLQICLPPLEEQKRFSEFMAQSDKSKFELQQAIEKVDNLIKSLIQQDNN